jgi:hypothetical protein
MKVSLPKAQSVWVLCTLMTAEPVVAVATMEPGPGQLAWAPGASNMAIPTRA